MMIPIKPYKSVAGALVFSLLLGPIGLLYASFWGGILMIALGMIAVTSQAIFFIFLTWIICCVWAVGASESYNRKIFASMERNNQSHEARVDDVKSPST